MKAILIRKYSESGEHTPLWRLAQNFLPRATQNVHILRKVFGNLRGSSRFCTLSVGSNDAMNCFADNKSVTRFFQTKAIPPALLNACDYVLQIIFKIAHTAGSINTAPDLLSRLELKFMEKKPLKIREDIQTTPIEVSTSSSDVAAEEQRFFAQAYKNDESEGGTNL